MGYDPQKVVQGALITFTGIQTANPANPTPPNRTFFAERLYESPEYYKYEGDLWLVRFQLDERNPSMWNAFLDCRDTSEYYAPFYDLHDALNEPYKYAFKNDYTNPAGQYYGGFGTVCPVSGILAQASLQEIADQLGMLTAQKTFSELLAAPDNKRVVRFARQSDGTCVYARVTT